MEITDLYAGSLRAIEDSWQSLPDKPQESPISTLRALWFCAAGQPRSITRACQDDLPALTQAQREELERLVEARIRGEPLAYLTGRQEFMGIEFLCTPEAMIPRKETEILGHAALEKVNQMAAERGWAEVLDLCTGCGNLALTLAQEQPACRVKGVDLSKEAVDLARKNAEFLGLSGRSEFMRGDLFQLFKDQEPAGLFDLIVCNPPYISSGRVKQMPAEISNFEPELAFDGGPFGLNVPWRLVNEAPAFLKAASWLCFEVGAGQGKALLRAFQNNSAYQLVEPHMDDSGVIRAFAALTASQ